MPDENGAKKAPAQSPRKPKPERKPEKPPLTPEEQEKRLRIFLEILGIVLVFLSVFLFLSFLKPESTGIVGQALKTSFFFWFGWASYLFPVISLYWGINLSLKVGTLSRKWISLLVIFLYLDAVILVQLLLNDGGLVGRFLGDGLENVFGRLGTYLFIFATGLGVVMILGRISFGQIFSAFVSFLKWVKDFFQWLFGLAFGRKSEESETLDTSTEDMPDLSESLGGDQIRQDEAEDEYEEEEEEDYAGCHEPEPRSEEIVPDHSFSGKSTSEMDVVQIPSMVTTEEKVFVRQAPRAFNYKLPPLNLLKTAEKKPSKEQDKDYSKKLEDVLASFRVEATVTEVVKGPTVTRYELMPAKGVKVQNITNLTNDIALALAAYSIRMEAPIPGKSAIGIEVPNQRVEPIFFRDILERGNYKKCEPLSLALGMDISGRPVMGSLLSAPHLLIAGATGSGKSVCINSIILSLIYKSTPLEVQMIMVDPKRVELSIFEGIPHLANLNLPDGKNIITDPKTATMALKTVADVMDIRYQEFMESRVKNIVEYNRKAETPIPYIVVIIDELADLMMLAKSNVEQYICRIAQLGRASGIHLILATQRPSVDVITGLIKANVPSRIAFAVSSQIDSRTILDRAGAEKLLGRGDMLYLHGGADPRRIQGAYVSNEENEQVVDFWKEQPPPENILHLDIDPVQGVLKNNNGAGDDTDELISEAIEVIKTTKKASVSDLQRRLSIGFTRAGRIMDQLEHIGVVGPAEGSKPRKILLPGFGE